MTVSAPSSSVAAITDAVADTRPKRKDIKSLTSLRFLCAVSLIIYHGKDCYPGWNDFVNSAVIEQALCFFFVLSGFVLTLNYSNLDITRGSAKFYLARFSRVWPAHLATLCLLIFLVPETFRVNAGNFGLFVGNLFLVQAWLPDWRTYFSFNAPAWSTSTELFFYLSFPFLILALRKHWFLALLPAATILVGMITYCNLNQYPTFSYGPCNLAFLYVHPFSRLFEFVSGMCAARLLVTQVSGWRINWWAATGLEIAIFILAYQMNVNSHTMSEVARPFLGGAGSYWLYNSGLPVAVMASMFIILGMERGAFSKLLSYRPFVFLGEISFSIYMLHGVMLTFRSLNFPHASSTLDCILFISILIIGSHLMSEVLERPMRDQMLKLGLLLNKKNHHAPSDVPKEKKPAAFSLKKIAILTAEACVLSGLIYAALPGVQAVTQKDVEQLRTTASVEDVTFAPGLKLLAAKAEEVDGSIKVTIAWESLQNQKMDILDEVSILDQSGKVMGSASHMQDLRFNRAGTGSIWKETFTVSGKDYTGAYNVSIKLLKSKRKPLTCMKDGAPQATLLIPVTVR